MCRAFLWRKLCALPFGGWAAFPIQENSKLQLVLWRLYNLCSVATTEIAGVWYELCTPVGSWLCSDAQWEVKLQPTGQRCFFSPASLSSAVQFLTFLCQRQLWCWLSMAVLWLLQALCSHWCCQLYTKRPCECCIVAIMWNHLWITSFRLRCPGF